VPSGTIEDQNDRVLLGDIPMGLYPGNEHLRPCHGEALVAIAGAPYVQNIRLEDVTVHVAGLVGEHGSGAISGDIVLLVQII
jgi:hypothetical protein